MCIRDRPWRACKRGCGTSALGALNPCINHPDDKIHCRRLLCLLHGSTMLHLQGVLPHVLPVLLVAELL
eukprot:851532-Alexandrium_andersonii.AAC.1